MDDKSDNCDHTGECYIGNIPRYIFQNAQILKGNSTAVGALLDGQSRAGSGLTPLMYAAKNGNIESVNALIELGADVNTVDHSGRTPLIHAACGGSDACVVMLIDKGADMNKSAADGFTPLIAAAEQGHFKCIEVLLQAGADVNALYKFKRHSCDSSNKEWSY